MVANSDDCYAVLDTTCFNGVRDGLEVRLGVKYQFHYGQLFASCLACVALVASICCVLA